MKDLQPMVSPSKGKKVRLWAILGVFLGILVAVMVYRGMAKKEPEPQYWYEDPRNLAAYAVYTQEESEHGVE